MADYGGPTKSELKLLRKIYRILKRAGEGGEDLMQEVSSRLLPLFDGILDGTVPVKTAKEANKTMTTHVQDRNADVRLHDTGLRDEALKESYKSLKRAFKAAQRKPGNK